MPVYLFTVFERSIELYYKEMNVSVKDIMLADSAGNMKTKILGSLEITIQLISTLLVGTNYTLLLSCPRYNNL